MERSEEELRQRAITFLAAGLDVPPEVITEHDGIYHWADGKPTWRDTTSTLDGTPLWEWTCPRCGHTGAATNVGVAYGGFSLHWKGPKCTRRKREAL